MAIDLREQALIDKYLNKNEDEELNISSDKSISMKQKEIDEEFDNLDITKFD